MKPVIFYAIWKFSTLEISSLLSSFVMIGQWFQKLLGRLMDEETYGHGTVKPIF